MLHLDAGAGALDYSPCRYGASRAVFRGPRRDLSQPYVAILGGTVAFGKYVETPYADLVEAALGCPVANLAALNAGPDFYLSDADTLDIAAGAAVVVLHVGGVEALSNPYYTVHSRRNDRFLAATPALRALYPEVDFADIHFTRHLLQVLERADPSRFGAVVSVLRQTWQSRMRHLLARLPARSVLVSVEGPGTAASDGDPLCVDRALIDGLRTGVTAVVPVVPSPRSRVIGQFDKRFPETEAAQAACLPGAAVHAEVAALLTPVLRALI